MSNFKDIGINNFLIELLKKRGIKNPTDIQNEAILPIENSKDIIAQAETGSGKTLAFLLPIFNKFLKSTKTFQTLILTPTRELAKQIYEEIYKLDEQEKYKKVLITGGKGYNLENNKLDQCNFIVATPGRLLDIFDKEKSFLNKLNLLVVDEVDQMLLMGFKNEMDKIVKRISDKRQTLCFSATINSQVKKLAYKICKDPKVIQIEKKEVILKNIDHCLIKTTDRNKQDSLCQLLNKQNPFMAIIFCRTKIRVDKLEEALFQKGFSCQKIHSDIKQSKREKIIKAFKDVQFQYLIATDVAARGLDVTGVTEIYNYDIPVNSKDYVHRIGRTGRAGEKGKAYLLISPKDFELFDDIKLEIDVDFKEIFLEDKKNIKATNELPQNKYNKRINTETKNFAKTKK